MKDRPISKGQKELGFQFGQNLMKEIILHEIFRLISSNHSFQLEQRK